MGTILLINSGTKPIDLIPQTSIDPAHSDNPLWSDIDTGLQMNIITPQGVRYSGPIDTSRSSFAPYLERINPGDKEHTITKIKKVVSGSDAESLDIIARTYEIIVTAGTHRASSIKVAEAAKIIENTQRDLNIALMNELSRISRTPILPGTTSSTSSRTTRSRGPSTAT